MIKMMECERDYCILCFRKTIPESLQLTDISIGQSQRFRTTGVKVVLVVIPPHFHHSHIVLYTHNGSFCYLIINMLVIGYQL